MGFSCKVQKDWHEYQSYCSTPEFNDILNGVKAGWEKEKKNIKKARRRRPAENRTTKQTTNNTYTPLEEL